MKSSVSTSVHRSPVARMEPYSVRESQFRSDRGDLIVRAAFARFDVLALAIASGCVGALGLFAATAILLARGAPPGVSVGTHLALLSHFLPGYNVSWIGSVVGVFYGFLLGFVIGGLIAVTWNIVHHIYLMLVTGRRSFAGDL